MSLRLKMVTCKLNLLEGLQGLSFPCNPSLSGVGREPLWVEAPLPGVCGVVTHLWR